MNGWVAPVLQDQLSSTLQKAPTLSSLTALDVSNNPDPLLHKKNPRSCTEPHHRPTWGTGTSRQAFQFASILAFSEGKLNSTEITGSILCEAAMAPRCKRLKMDNGV